MNPVYGSPFSEKVNDPTAEELNLRLRKQLLANLGKNNKQEDDKMRQLSVERHKTKSQLLQQSSRKQNLSLQRPVAVLQDPSQQVSNISKTIPYSISYPRQVGAKLPLVSPLQNVMNFAELEEEIVQTKITYAMAEKTLRLERQALGRATEDTVQRVKTTGKTLAELYEKRDAIAVDRKRLDEFRKAGNRPDLLPRPVSAAKTATSSNGLSNTNIQDELQHVLKDDRPDSSDVRAAKKNDHTASGDQPPTFKEKQIALPSITPSEQVVKVESDPVARSEYGQIMSNNVQAEDEQHATVEKPHVAACSTRQVRFALTDVETFI